MTHSDFKVLFTALGFLAIVMQGKTGDDGAAKAKELARLIEEFCRETLLEQCAQHHPVSDPSAVSIDETISQFKSRLVEKEEAFLPQDRATLLQFYERLIARQIQRREQAFYDIAPDDMIANRVLTMIDEEINADEERKRLI